MVFIVVFLNEGPLEKQHLLKGYPSQIYQIKSKSIKSNGVKKISWPWMQALEFSKQVTNVPCNSLKLLPVFRAERRPGHTWMLPDRSGLGKRSRWSDACEPSATNWRGWSKKKWKCDSYGDCFTHKKPNSLRRRKRKATDDVDFAILEELKKTSQPTPSEIDEDEDSLFMKSLVPQIKRLNSKIKARVIQLGYGKFKGKQIKIITRHDLNNYWRLW